jgi:hypothetical protein
MGGLLSVVHDIDDTLLEAYIFTPGQGICLQKRTQVGRKDFCFDQNLCYGSWYDILFVICPTGTGGKRKQEDIYLKIGVYLTHGK